MDTQKRVSSGKSAHTKNSTGIRMTRYKEKQGQAYQSRASTTKAIDMKYMSNDKQRFNDVYVSTQIAIANFKILMNDTNMAFDDEQKTIIKLICDKVDSLTINTTTETLDDIIKKIEYLNTNDKQQRPSSISNKVRKIIKGREHVQLFIRRDRLSTFIRSLKMKIESLKISIESYNGYKVKLEPHHSSTAGGGGGGDNLSIQIIEEILSLQDNADILLLKLNEKTDNFIEIYKKPYNKNDILLFTIKDFIYIIKRLNEQYQKKSSFKKMFIPSNKTKLIVILTKLLNYKQKEEAMLKTYSAVVNKAVNQEFQALLNSNLDNGTSLTPNNDSGSGKDNLSFERFQEEFAKKLTKKNTITIKNNTLKTRTDVSTKPLTKQLSGESNI